MKTALDFSEIDGGMLAEVGGKAANLGELTRAGLPVPPGWVLTTEAYHEVAQAAGLDDVIATGGPGLAAAARTRLLEAPIPEAIAESIREAYTTLGQAVQTPKAADAAVPVVVPVAVRSSATAEDLPFASFAGQQDTYLNVVGADAVLDAVRRCWASLWTERAVAYRDSNGIDHASVRLAVVVQVMVDSRTAGVMFTANPLTGRRHEAVIDANPGLGEAVVSGAVNPDRFVVDSASGEILDRHAGDKRLAIRALPGGGTERVESAHDGLCLTDEQVRDLAALGTRVEDHYGAPQDTEWAIDADGTLWLTQARPITTLYPLPETTREGLRAYFSVNVAQGVMGPVTPMGLSAFQLISAGAAGLFGYGPARARDGAAFMFEAGERTWLDLTTALRSRMGRAILPRVLTMGEARAAAMLTDLFADPRFSVIHTSRRPFLRAVARFARRVHAPTRVLQALIRPTRALAYTRRLGVDLDRRLRVPGSATPVQRLDHAERMLSGAFPVIVSLMPIAITGYGLFGLAAKLSGLSISDMQDVLRSVPNNPTTEMDLELWALATRIEPEPFRNEPVSELLRRFRAAELPPKAQRGITAFLDKYGHRGVAEIDLGLPRWSEDPTHILGVLANYLRMEDGGDLAPDKMFARGAAEAEAAVARIVATARRKGALRGAVARFGLRRTRMFAGVREMPKYYAVQTLAAVRRSLLVVGEHLVTTGVLETADDVFFLRIEEARSALGGGDLRELVTERRAAYERESRRRHVPRIVLSDGTEPEALASVAAEGALIGSAASAGTVTGRARVVLDPVGAHLEPGEILVCPSTDPGWTPLFLTAGGLVMEMGGAMSHGAVVAREYGIPAVVGVPDATHRIVTGQEITVNGAAGTVTITEPEPAVENEDAAKDEPATSPA
ncbi:PEP/pyruvate-binding domain-containing protein [Nonomuraea sp. NEAU-A123]|uniref:PEP/pyruvate-binding domain-containing protein n=1 Tax=Nonomuraea sp. NEAU-A123 TaxID=2839649 RepID=UPI001BE47D1C|nr:PEP/pyruvate-binding domain-containing protein [Nonomuraea sp. NEAU-A123]MBT2227077.1 phosphoenolpyruvate synthase [Nonomuraea sp. NEAU-A123]